MLVWLAKAHALVDPIKADEGLVQTHHRADPAAHASLLWLMKPGRPGRFFRRLARIRRRMQAQPAE